VFDEPEDPLSVLRGHRDIVVDRLRTHRRSKRHWEKYRWLGEYHNAIVRRRLPKAGELLIASPARTWQFSSFE